MNIISLGNFYRELNQIREYLKHIYYVNDIAIYSILETDNEQIKSLINNLKWHYKSFGRDKKLFEYKATIISLYGLLEKYTEIWMKEYLDSLSLLINNYDQIDEKIKINHFDLSLKLISTITSRESAKYQHLTKEQVLEKLNECIKNPSNYKFNTEAFVLLSGNLKHSKIVELFRPINIDLNNGLKRNESLNKYIQTEQQTHNISNLKTDTLYNKVNDLVDRRNTIAHGSEVIDDLLDTSILESYINFLEVYCQAIFETLFQEFIKQEISHTFQKIETVHKVWENSILGCEVENYKIKTGDFLIVCANDGNVFKKEILSIGVDNINHLELNIKSKMNIGIKVEPTINENQTFYLEKNKVSY